jgi:hypothetical protein
VSIQLGNLNPSPEYYFPDVTRGELCAFEAMSVGLLLTNGDLSSADSISRNAWRLESPPVGEPVCHVTTDPSRATSHTPPFENMDVYAVNEGGPDNEPGSTDIVHKGRDTCERLAGQVGLVVTAMDGTPIQP